MIEIKDYDGNIVWQDDTKLQFKYCDFVKINLTNCDFSNLSLKNCDFRGTKLDNCSFQNAKLDNCDFWNARVSGCWFWGAKLDNCNFKGAQVYDGDFWNAKLDNCNFRGAQVSTSNFRKAQVKNTHIPTSLDHLKYQPSIIAFKYLDECNMSPISGSKIKYEVGKTYSVDEYDTNPCNDCGTGLHVATAEWVYENIEPLSKIIVVQFQSEDIVCIPYCTTGKFRVKKFFVVKEITQEELLKLYIS